MYDTFEWGDKPKYKHHVNEVLKKSQEILRDNVLKRIKDVGEIVHEYVTAVLKLAGECNFGGLKESHIRDILVSGTRDDSARQKLLGKKGLTLRGIQLTPPAY